MGGNYSWESLVQPIMTWGSTINLPWFVTGTGISVPAGIAIGSSLTSNVQGFTLVSLMLYLPLLDFACKAILRRLALYPSDAMSTFCSTARLPINFNEHSYVDPVAWSGTPSDTHQHALIRPSRQSHCIILCNTNTTV